MIIQKCCRENEFPLDPSLSTVVSARVSTVLPNMSTAVTIVVNTPLTQPV